MHKILIKIQTQIQNTIFFNNFVLLLEEYLPRKAFCLSFGVKHRLKS